MLLHRERGLEFDPDAEPPGPIEVSIDVKPGSFPNSVNPRSNGVVPVAILTTGSFDALSVDAATLRFSGPAGAPIAHSSPHAEDVDGDPIAGTDGIRTVGCK